MRPAEAAVGQGVACGELPAAVTGHPPRAGPPRRVRGWDWLPGEAGARPRASAASTLSPGRPEAPPEWTGEMAWLRSRALNVLRGDTGHTPTRELRVGR